MIKQCTPQDKMSLLLQVVWSRRFLIRPCACKSFRNPDEFRQNSLIPYPGKSWFYHAAFSTVTIKVYSHHVRHAGSAAASCVHAWNPRVANARQSRHVLVPGVFQ